VLETLQIHQLRTPKARPADLPLLRLGVAENPVEPRCAFMLGRELAMRGHCAEAIEELQRYLALPAARWSSERAAAMVQIAKCHTRRGDKHQALDWARRAAGEQPLCGELQDWTGVVAACRRALAVKERSADYTNRAYAWGAYPFELLSTALWNLDDRAAARGVRGRTGYRSAECLSSC